MGLDKEKELQNLLNQKKSKAFYAKRLGISEDEVQALLDNIRKKNPEGLDEEESTYDQNFEKQEIKVSKLWSFAPKPEDVIKEHKIDESKWKLSQIWIKQTAKGYLTSAAFTPKAPTQIDQSDFVEILKVVKPVPKILRSHTQKTLPKAALVFPKQDAHLNKFDIYGKNDIEERFKIIQDATEKVIRKATVSNTLEKIIYIVGSDQFNSEWTQATTKGTPQQNIMEYHEAFKKIAEHEAGMIQYLLTNADRVEIVFIPGNHDHFVGWHLVHWLQAFFNKNDRLSFDTNPLNRKYERYHRTAIMLNHGDALKGRDLAQKFPIEFKDKWSSCDNFLIFTGDKHHEMSQDISGIKFYQVPALSNAKSFWDDKNGHTCTRAEMTAFLITAINGLTDIYKEIL